MGMVAAVAVAALAGVTAAITVGSPGPRNPTTVVARRPEASSAPAVTGAAGQTATIIPGQSANPPVAVGVPGTAAPTVLPAHPTAEDVQRMLTGLTAQILAAPGSATGTPLTKAQVEDQVRAQLGQLGITY